MEYSSKMLSGAFQQLYCDAAIFDNFGTFHPINLKRVLPFQSQDAVIDDPRLLAAELAYLASQNDDARRDVVDAYVRCGLLSPEDAVNMKSVGDFFESDFFDFMGLVYANAGMFICALRWYREEIVQLEAKPELPSDEASVYASVGYCLYALGLFEEAIAWTKSCIGARLVSETASRILIEHEAQLAGGKLLAIERAAGRIRYTVSTLDPASASQNGPRLKMALDAIGLRQETYISWVSTVAPAPQIQEGYPFRVERDSSDFMRHKMNLLFASCGQADVYIANGRAAEARKLLLEAAMLEPNADFIQERIQALS